MKDKILKLIKETAKEHILTPIVAKIATPIVLTITAYITGIWIDIKNLLIMDVSLKLYLMILVASAPFIIFKIFYDIYLPKNNLKKKLDEIIADIDNPEISVSTLLRKTKRITNNINKESFTNFINNELNGYGEIEAEQLPDYRKIYGSPKVFNPYTGWQPALFEKTESRELFSYAPNSQDIPSIEDILKDSPEELTRGLSPKQMQIALKAFDGGTNFKVVINITSIQNIINKTRSQLDIYLTEIRNTL